jgi:hypothetical protein
MQNINPYNNCQQVPALNDVEYLWGKITRNEFAVAVGEVQLRWEWNHKSCIWTLSCPHRDNYEAVISAYYNMASKKIIPEYRDKSADAQKVINEVAKVSLKDKQFVKDVLNYLYWGSIDKTGDISQKISLPITSEYKKEERDIPVEYQQTFSKTVTDTLGGLSTTLKWAGVIAAVGIGAYALTQVNTTAKLLGKGK